MSPAKGTQVRTVRVDDELWGRMVEAAEAEGIPPSEYVRQAIRGRLDREQEQS